MALEWRTVRCIESRCEWHAHRCNGVVVGETDAVRFGRTPTIFQQTTVVHVVCCAANSPQVVEADASGDCRWRRLALCDESAKNEQRVHNTSFDCENAPHNAFVLCFYSSENRCSFTGVEVLNNDLFSSRNSNSKYSTIKLPERINYR